MLLRRFLLANGVLFGGLHRIGAFLLHQEVFAWSALVVLVLCVVLLRDTRSVVRRG